MKVVAVAGARPNFMKIAPLMRVMEDRADFEPYLVHTGQHYDRAMSQLFFEELQIPRPDVDLAVGSGSHAVQTAEVMKRFEPVLQEQTPDCVLVVGDVNSTLACTLVAVKLGVPVAHVEAGLRSFDRTMPEEINRLMTDAVAQHLFVSERSGVENLRREGVADDRIFFVGNVMIDTLLRHRRRSEESDILERLRLSSRQFGVLTLHRPANVDDPEQLDALLAAINRIGKELPIVFPVHPRTRAALVGMRPLDHLAIIDPLGYLDFLKLMGHARIVLTDSGGIQEETTVLGVPCLTLRHNTERPATIEEGTNRLVGCDPEEVYQAAHAVLTGPPQRYRVPELWDGRAAERVVGTLEKVLNGVPGEELIAA